MNELGLLDFVIYLVRFSSKRKHEKKSGHAINIIFISDPIYNALNAFFYIQKIHTWKVSKNRYVIVEEHNSYDGPRQTKLKKKKADMLYSISED